MSLPLWPIRQRWFHTFSPCAELLGDGHEGMWARFGSQGSIALNWHSRYSGTRYSGTWLYNDILIETKRRTYAWVEHTNIASDNGLSPDRRQAIIWTNAAILSIRHKGTYFSEILFKIQMFSFKKMHLEISFPISLSFVPVGLIGNRWALVQVMAWHRADNKSLFELMVIQFDARVTGSHFMNG